MRISNIRVLNNYKVKLINARLSAINLKQETVAEQGTRYPVVPTPPTPTRTFQEKFDIVFDYLMKRYEPGWSAADVATGKAATMALLGVSSAVNPLILGGTVEASFNYTTGDMDDGWFDPLTHPKDFAAAVRTAYKRCERARSPKQAKHKFIHYNLNGIYCQDFLYQGGNAYYGYHPDFDWSPGNTLIPRQLYMGYTAGINNGVCRQLLHSPYGNLVTPMNVYAGNWRRFPWLSDRYTGESFIYDMYLLCRENTTLRDLLTNHTVIRDANLGVMIDGTGDANINTLYRGLCFPAGAYTKYPSYDDYGRTAGGFSADQVLVGSPWIPFSNGITYSSWWGSGAERAGLCFNPETLVLFDGSTFPSDPQDISNLILRPPMSDSIGLSFGYGQKLVNSLNQLSAAYGNTMEFIAYFGNLPYGTGIQMRVPFALYADPTVSGNAEYFRWRLDASVAHWKEKFLSPVDGFAHVDIDASAIIERTYHRWQPPGFTLWTNIAQSGESYVENIPVGWARDQYNYTFGSSGPNPTKGVVLGTERFAQYMFKDDVGVFDPTRNDQRRFNGDTNPRHWCLDDDKPTDLMTSCHDMFLGQRKWGLTYSNSIWGMGVCGSSTLGEIHAACIVEDMSDTNKSAMSGFPFLYNTFITVQDNGDIKWKRVPGTFYNGTSDGVPWVNDRRFRLFYLYPTCLALNLSILDQFYSGVSYYNIYNRTGWFDKTLGNNLQQNMEANGVGAVVSDFPFPGRRTPVTPPQNFWTGNARTSEFELLYACMKGGITAGLDSLHFTQLYNELEPSGAEVPPERTGYFRALNYELFGTAYFPFTGDVPTIVPMINPRFNSTGQVDPALMYFRNYVSPGSTAELPSDLLNAYTYTVQQIPLERRVFLPTYWLLDGPSNQRPGDYYFKQTADGTTYTGGIPGATYLSTDYGGTWDKADTNPLKFNTPWSYVNRQVAKDSFKNFLQQSKNLGYIFTEVNDDAESLGTFGLGGFYNGLPTGSQSSLDSFASGSNTSYQEIPDARRLVAITEDPRFNGITNSITNRTLAEEFVYNYNQILQSEGQGACGASAETILGTYFTNVTNRNDFKPPWGVADRLYQYYAWDSAIYTFCHGDLKSKIIGGSIDETTGFAGIRKYSSDVYAMNGQEAKFATDLNGHRRLQAHIPGYGHQVHCYGQLSGGFNASGGGGFGGLINSYGYPPQSTMEENTRFGKSFGWHPVAEDGITFGNSAYQAFVADIRRIRGILRSRPDAYIDGISPWMCGGISGSFGGWSGDAPFTQFYEGNSYAREYYLEELYHLCLNGARRINFFNASGDVSLGNQGLIDWSVISGNTFAKPCTNATATVGATVDRIDLYEAARYGVISGAMTTDPTKRLWRITVPPECSTLVKTSTNQPDLPSTITIQDGSRGTWIEAPASYGKPQYEPVGRYYFGLDPSRRMYVQFNIGINGAGAATAAIWNDVTDTFIATFKGTPMTGTRAYPWEANPANPTVSSPWHNVVYENCIDAYNWGARAFYIYMPWGSFSTAFYLTPEIWRRTFTNLDGNTYAVPARWKGFTGAVKALLEGDLAPSGKTAMTEPCNVMLYHGSNNGYTAYRSKSTSLWDSFTGTTADKDAKYYEYLDSWTDQLISMKSSDPTKGRLSITLDASAPSADPSTLPLYRSTSNYRSDALELADWYIFNKLKNAGIDVYTEARAATKRNSVPEFGGTVGATSDILWAKEASHNEEYTIWYANPANADPNIDIMQKDEDSPGFVRLLGPNFPVRVDGDPNRDPFQPKLNIKLSDGRGVTLDHIIHGVNALYTPHYYAWQIYALSDNYRKYYNRSVGAEYLKGVKQKTENLIAYIHSRVAKCDVVISVYDGVQNPQDKYWRLPTTIADSYKPMFDLTRFNNSVSGGGAGPIYGSLGTTADGFWTQQGIDYLNNNVLQTSFSNFINFLHTYSENYAPPNSAGWTGNIYGTTADVLANNLIPIIPV